MDKLWAPWRIHYIQGSKAKGCIFCRAARSARDKKKNHYIVLRDKYAFAMLNLYPYNNGHLMISPIRHVAHLESLTDRESAALFKMLTHAKLLLDKALKPHGYNIGINVGAVAGAGVAGHLHIHIVPRWNADTNFMPVCADTKIISQSLTELYTKLYKLAHA